VSSEIFVKVPVKEAQNCQLIDGIFLDYLAPFLASLRLGVRSILQGHAPPGFLIAKARRLC
jgi:hypothetical protein